jgi:hypothetical protein
VNLHTVKGRQRLLSLQTHSGLAVLLSGGAAHAVACAKAQQYCTPCLAVACSAEGHKSSRCCRVGVREEVTLEGRVGVVRVLGSLQHITLCSSAVGVACGGGSLWLEDCV